MKKALCTIILVLLASAGGSAAASIMLDKIVAVVNSEAITWSELYRNMEFELSKKMESATYEQKMEIFKENEAAFLETMISKKLQLQEAGKKKITAGAKDVDRAILSMREKFSMDEKAFLEAVGQEGFTVGQYREMLREQIVIGRLVEREVKSSINVSEEDVKRYVRKRRLGAPTLYRIRQIFIGTPEGEDAQAAWRKMSEVQERLASGEDFAELATLYSEDASARTGGDTGFIRKESLSGKFREILEGMAPGDVSSPFSTGKGVHIVKLEEVRDVRDIIRDERFEHAYRQWLRGLRENSFIEIRL
jgi:peptidyl-prolyl cis-trans isomerase SurA